MGLHLRFRRYDRFAIFFQGWDVVCDDLPSGFRINSAVAVRHNIPHGFDLPPGNGRMLRPKFIGQLSDQFADL